MTYGKIKFENTIIIKVLVNKKIWYAKTYYAFYTKRRLMLIIVARSPVKNTNLSEFKLYNQEWL